jgi:hypothetical protein
VLVGKKGLGFQEEAVLMRVTVEVRENAFRKHKTARHIEEEVREGATLLWLARGDVEPGEARSVVEPVPPADAALPPLPGHVVPVAGEPGIPRGQSLMDVLLSMPDVGEDADFERPMSYGRPDVDLG